MEVLTSSTYAANGAALTPPEFSLTLESLSSSRCVLQISRVLMNQMTTAAADDVCDILEMFAAAYWHPSVPVLHAIETKLDSNCGELPVVSLCTSLWSFAIFAHVPNISFQRTYANRIETDISQLNPFQLCSVLWVFALFRSCTMGVWNTLVGKLRTFNVSAIDESALKYFFQVCPVVAMLVNQNTC